jgi:hypothetical protein
VLDSEGVSNSSRTQLCQTFSGQLKIEMVRDPENKNFKHAQAEVLKAFGVKGN